MSETHTIIETYQRPGAEIKATKEYSGESFVTLVGQSIPDGSTDMLLAVSFDVSQIQLLIINSTQDVTLKVNNSTTGTPTIALKANVPYVWRKTDSYDSNLLDTDVTKFYVTNSSGSEAIFDLVALIDPTP